MICFSLPNVILVSAIFINISACSSSSLKSDLSVAELQKIENAAQNDSHSSNEFQTYKFANKEDVKLIAPGDLISMTYSHDSKLSGSFRVNFDGKLNLPYSVHEYVVGLSYLELVRQIRSRYANLYNNVDDIAITLVERKRWVQVTGDVSPVGFRLVDIDADITQILSQKQQTLANTTEERKKLKYLKIDWKNSALILNLKRYFNNEITWGERKWHGGEILSFQSNMAPDDNEFPLVRVMGEVNDPGSYELEEGKDFYSYILKAGGIKSSANLEHIYLIRGDQFKRKVYDMNLDDIVKYGIPQSNDTIVLFQDRTSSSERRLQMLASIASILSALTIFGMVF